MSILLIIVALLTLALCWQVYRMTDSRAVGTTLNVIIIATASIVGVSLLESSTATTIAQDATNNIPILDTAFVQATEVLDSIDATGQISPDREVELAFQYTAPVTEIFVEVGDVVEEGQVLARLDASDIDQNFQIAVINNQIQQINFDELIGNPREVDLAAAEAALTAAQLNFGGSTVLTGDGSTQAEIQRLQLELAKNRMWQTALSRDNALEQVISSGYNLEIREEQAAPGGSQYAVQQAYDSSLSSLYSVEGSLNSLDANLAYSEGQYQAELVRPPRYGGSPGAATQRTQAEQDLDLLLNGPDELDYQLSQIDLALANFARAQAELQLDYVELRAPFSGVITEMNLTVGEMPPAFGAVVMMDNSRFEVNLDIDEIDIMQVRVGQDVDFIVDALPDDDITGTVAHVAMTPNQNTQVVTYSVRVLLDETDANIRAGMSTTGQVIITSIDGALGVPTNFVLNDAVTGSAYVIVQNPNGSLQRIAVTPGAVGNGQVQIIGGIMPQQRVVLVASENVEQIPYRGNTNG